VGRDGSTIAFSAGDAPAASLRVARTADADTALFAPSTTHDSATLALTHDGGRVLVSVAGRLSLRDTATGATLAMIDDTHLGNLHGFHPEFSPDDSSVVLTLSAQGDSDWSVSTGAIGVVPYNKDISGAGAFGQAEILVGTGTEFNFYPTWSPDGQWIAFATAPVGALQSSYIQNNARLRIVNRATKAVFELANATYKAGRTSTWPKFAPVAQMDGLMFLTFNSKNDYGFVRPNNAGGFPQMWMTSIDPKKLVAGGGDASTTPVWLPFQDPTKHSYLGCWSERVGCRLVGTQSIGCGDHEICSNGACAMVSP
jgi:Tol biopolymer transport system component